MAAMVQRLRASVISTPTASLINLIGLAIVAVALVATAQRVYQGGATYFFQTIGFGLAQGAIFALVALGYTMVYGIIELINFAHGDVFTLGAFVSLALMPVFGLNEGRISGAALILPLLGLFVVTMLICALVNVGIERVAYRPLRHAPRLAPLITGEEIMAVRGIGPGPEVGRIKKRLEELVIDGEIAPDRAAVIDYLATHSQL